MEQEKKACLMHGVRLSFLDPKTPKYNKRRSIMSKLLILIERSNLVAEYVSKNIFESTPKRAKGSLTVADIFVESPYQTCVSVIVNSRQSLCSTYGR
jgi:hypothetical protein